MPNSAASKHPELPVVLAVEDDAATRSALASAIELRGFRPLAVESAEEALAEIEKSAVEPSLALCDVRLPGMSGIGLLSRLKPRFPRMPVILVTGYGSLETAVEALRLGAADYIAKPLSHADIERALAYATNGLSGEARIPGATMAEIERVAILRTFAACGRSSHKTAAVLQVSVRKIQYRLKEYRSLGLLPHATSGRDLE